MKIFHCDNCHHTVYFENTYCEKCNSLLGYYSGASKMVAIATAGGLFHSLRNPEQYFHFCANHAYDVCNWLMTSEDPNQLCSCCRLNETIPNLDTEEFLTAWRKLEFAKHRLIYSLHRFGLPLYSKKNDARNGLAFSFLSQKLLSEDETLYTGHDNGLITIRVSEADSVNREQIRNNMLEPYRTLIGHFRHEVGHYYWNLLIRDDPKRLEGFRKLFGDDRKDYAQSLKEHYERGAGDDWRNRFISAYAGSHPWEDWAETWAHYLHLAEIMDTAHSFGMKINEHSQEGNKILLNAPFDPYVENDFDRLIKDTMPLIFAVNSMNRSMGQPDLYPFVHNDDVIRKLRFIHELIWGVRR